MSALHAEVDFLLSRADHVFLPFYLERRAEGNGHRRQYCYYTQYAPALSAHACATTAEDTRRVLTPLVHYLYGSLHTQLQLYRMLQSIGLTRIGFADVYRAFDRACGFKAAALQRLKRRYQQETAGVHDIHAVLLGRPYTVLSRRMNKGIPDIFGALGVKAFFQDMLPDDHPVAEALKPLFKEIHWHYAAAILRAAETAAGTDGAYPVLVTAFRCAPDSFVIEFFKSIMDAHRKPYLILQLDEHGSSVGYETRIEAAVRSFRNHFASRLRPQPAYSANLFPRSSSAVDGKTLLLPDWDHLSLRSGRGQPETGRDRRPPAERHTGGHPPQPAAQQRPMHPGEHRGPEFHRLRLGARPRPVALPALDDPRFHRLQPEDVSPFRPEPAGRARRRF